MYLLPPLQLPKDNAAMEAGPPDNRESPKRKQRRGHVGLLGLVAGFFGEDASELASFDFATLTFVGWITLVSTFSVWIVVVAFGAESHFLNDLPIWLNRLLLGLLSVFLATAWFKFMRTLVEAVGLSLCKDSKHHDDGI
jgi:hypothetical protein